MSVLTIGSVDQRGFDYTLEPLNRKEEWHLDALRARMGKLLRQIDGVCETLEQLRTNYHAQCTAATHTVHLRIDADAYQRTLIYLAQLHTQIKQAEDKLTKLRNEYEAVRSDCVKQQQKLEQFAQHRQTALLNFTVETFQRQTAEADRDWLMRQQWLSLQKKNSLRQQS